MSQLAFQSHCSPCEATAAQWARVNACAHTKQDLSTPGKPYPIPPSFGTESHPYARQIGETEFMTVPGPEAKQNKVPQTKQNKVWTQPKYNVVVKKNVDMSYANELIANIFPPGAKSGPMPPRPNVPTPPGVPPRHDLSGLGIEDAFPPPRSYVPPRPPPRTYGQEMDDAFPPPRPYVPPRPPPRTYGLEMEDGIPPPRPYIPTPPYERLSGFNPEDSLPTPRQNVPLPPDAPPAQSLSCSNPDDALPTPRPNVPLPPDAPPNQSLSGFNTEDALPFATV